jgi:hypothetical protein
MTHTLFKGMFLLPIIVSFIFSCNKNNSASGPGLETTNTITAKILASNGAPLVGAKVSIYDQNYKMVQSGKTDSLGEYKINLSDGFFWFLANFENTYRQKRMHINGLESNIILFTDDVVRIIGKAPAGIQSVNISGGKNSTIPNEEGIFILENVPTGDVDICYNTLDTTYILSVALYGTGELYVRQPSKWPAASYEWSGGANATVWSEPYASGEDTAWEVGVDFGGVAYLGWYNNKQYSLLDENGDRTLLLDDFMTAGHAQWEPWTSALWFPIRDASNSTIEIGGNRLRFDAKYSTDDSLSFAGFGYFFAMENGQKSVNLERLKGYRFMMRGAGVVQTQLATEVTENDEQGNWRRFYSKHLLRQDWQEFSVEVDTLKRLENAPHQWKDASDSVFYAQWIWLADEQISTQEPLWAELKNPYFVGINLSDLLFSQ